VQSFVRWVGLQLVFQLLMAGNLARLFPLLAGVVVGDVPEFAGTPPVLVQRLRNLCVVADGRSMGTVDFQHRETPV